MLSAMLNCTEIEQSVARGSLFHEISLLELVADELYLRVYISISTFAAYDPLKLVPMAWLRQGKVYNIV